MADKNIITLTEGEIMLARTIASFRTGLNRITNVGQPLKISNQDNFTNDLIGICGEMAFAKRMNIYLDFSFNPRSGGSDCKLREWTDCRCKNNFASRWPISCTIMEGKEAFRLLCISDG